MKVVDLADEFGLTTAEAVDACLWAGVPAESSASELSTEDVRHVRAVLASWIDDGFAPWRDEAGDAGEDGDRGGGDEPGSADGPVEDRGYDRFRRSSSRAGGGDGRRGGERGGEGGDGGSDKPTARRPTEAPRATQPFAGVPMTTVGATATLTRVPAADLELDPSVAEARRAGWLPAGPDARPHPSPLAMLALALGILALVIPFAPAVGAFLVATVANDRIKRSRGWSTGKGLVRAARILAAIGIVLWLVIIAGSIAKEALDDRPRGVVDVQVSKGSLPYDEIRAGDCVRFPEDGSVVDWDLVECAEQHDAEVTGRVTANNPQKTPYPGDGPIRTTAANDCNKALDGYLDGLPRNPDLEVAAAYPSPGSWDVLGDRTIVCLAFRADGTPLIGSLATTQQ